MITPAKINIANGYLENGLAVKATRKIVRNDIDHRQVRLLDKVWPRLEWVGDCLEYTGRLTFNGYGEVDEWHEGATRHQRVHRLVYALTVGPIPDGLNVLHSCDNRKCANPGHLRAGTQRENIQEASQRGRLDNGMSARTHCPRGHPYAVACSLLEKESGGRNIYGNDHGGALAGFPGEVTKGNYAVFKWLVFAKGMPSNGVGPCQLTYKGFFTAMEDHGLKPWKVLDNCGYGFRVLRRHYHDTGSWAEAGQAYNGSPAYGTDLARKIDVWKKRFK